MQEPKLKFTAIKLELAHQMTTTSTNIPGVFACQLRYRTHFEIYTLFFLKQSKAYDLPHYWRKTLQIQRVFNDLLKLEMNSRNFPRPWRNIFDFQELSRNSRSSANPNCCNFPGLHTLRFKFWISLVKRRINIYN